MVEVTLKIEGKVQGVFFRAEAAEKARQLNITGWIKNEDDDSLTCVAQGDKNSLDRFIDWCRKGPPRANVKAVSINWNEAPGNSYLEFAIYLI